MTIAEHFQHYWNSRRFIFLYHEKHDEFQRDYEALKSKCEKVAEMEVGETVEFDSGIEMKVLSKSRDNRYVALATEGGATYSIVDTQYGIAGPTDRTFQLVNFNDISEVNSLLECLRKGEYKLSYRNSAPIDRILKI